MWRRGGARYAFARGDALAERVAKPDGHAGGQPFASWDATPIGYRHAGWGHPHANA